jgi:hypothetical protein
MRLPPLFLLDFASAARRIDPLDDPARAGCARFVKLARKIRLSSMIQQKRFSRIGKRRKLFPPARRTPPESHVIWNGCSHRRFNP